MLAPQMILNRHIITVYYSNRHPFKKNYLGRVVETIDELLFMYKKTINPTKNNQPKKTKNPLKMSF